VRDIVYPPVVALTSAVFRALGLRVTIDGSQNVPRSGGAVLASNHVSYLDFTFVGYGAKPQGRLVRFMAKESVFRHRVSGPLMRGMHHIPVDREAGSAAFREALAALKAGEVVGVFPEATISQSFMLKEFKPGAARMAQAAGVPIIPTIVWGGQRLYTKGHPRDFTHRGKAITIAYGEPLTPAKKDDSAAVMDELINRMATMLDRVQRSYPDQPSGPDDRWWVPASLGGTAPTPAEAAAAEEAERSERAERARRATG
jgi:1-acyl-sn-glycerol-3-phosphate acyltransferase